MSHESKTPPTALTSQQHEGTGVKVWIITLCGLGLLGVVMASMLVASGVRQLFSQGPHPAIERSPTVSRSVARVPLNPQEKKTRQAYEKEQLERLSTYGWKDRSHGKVRIPIDRAMAILLEKNREGDK